MGLLQWPVRSALSLVAGLIVVSSVCGQATTTTTAATNPVELRTLSDDELQAMSVINERTVRATVSFLASDELGGRGTPSPGFTIACAYVASRFEAAGLKGLGNDGSFFQTTELETIQLPSAGIRIAGPANSSWSHYGLIGGSAEPLNYDGPVSVVADWAAWDDLSDQEKSDLHGAVLMTVSGTSAGRRQLRQWSNRANKVRDHGGTVLILAVDDGNELIQLASQLASKPQWVRQTELAELPILLVDHSLENDGTVQINIPAAITGKQPISNVIGVLPGSDPELAEQAIVFSAHLDHLGTRDNGLPDQIYNGADDDASGVTGVLSLADAFGALESPPARTTIFIAFWGEELGLLGSREFVEHPDWPLPKIVAMVNLEMIGRPEPGANEKAWMTGWENSSLGVEMARGSARVGVEIFEHPSYSSQLYRASDNWPFVQAGVVAHSFSAGSLHEDYHQPDDRWEKLETRHMTRVIQGLFAGALPLAEGLITPVRRGD